MRLAVAFLAFVALAAGCERHAGEAPATVPGSTHEGPQRAALVALTEDAVGAARIGMTMPELSRVVRVVRDTEERGHDGIPERIAVLLISGDTVRAGFDDSARVFRYNITTPRFRTSDSLGVNSTLASLLPQQGLYGLGGERHIFLVSPRHCGLTFRLGQIEGAGDTPDSLDISELRRLPATSRIAEVLVLGCQTAK